MAETIGQHNIASITAPVNGQPQDANVVRGNDNLIRTEHNAHDNDPGIHLQSSTFALRPAAGTAGRKWVTEDDGNYELWYDDGARWHHVSAGFLIVDAIADSTLTAGKIVKITGFNVGQSLPRVDVTSSASDVAFGIVLRDVASGGIASIVNTGLVSPVDANGYAPGTILYHGGSGGFTSTQPASGSYQACAIVLRGNSSNGALYVEFSEPATVEATAATANTLVKRDGSGNIAAVGVTATSLSGTLAASNVQPGTFPNGTFTVQNLTITGTQTGGASPSDSDWTPTANVISYSSATGKATKTGRMVTVWGSVVFPSTSDGNTAEIKSLPYTSLNIGSGQLWPMAAIATKSATNDRLLSVAVVNNGTKAHLYEDGTSGPLNNSNLSDSTVYFCGTYFTT